MCSLDTDGLKRSWSPSSASADATRRPEHSSPIRCRKARSIETRLAVAALGTGLNCHALPIPVPVLWDNLRNTGDVIRLVATDLDGTFWGRNFVPPAEHVTAVHELARRDVSVLAATSRRPRVTKQRLADVGLKLPAVMIDGAVGIDFRTDERFHEATFGAEAAMHTLAAFRAHGLDPCMYIDHPDIDIAVSTSPSTCPEHLERLGHLAGTCDLDEIATAAAVYAFSILGLDHELLAPLAGELADWYGTTVVLFPEPDYGRFGLIVNPRGVSKWSGIEAYCKLHGIATEEVAAVGDGLNDLDMLRRAEVRIGVEGGRAEVVEMADFLIEPPERGGWEAILGIIDNLR
jgi:hydroxymethylpyrimidine pyrophosphatase-like HAD family hydrolase